MSQETTYAGILGDWQRLLGPLKDNSEELVALEGLRAKLEGLLAQALAIQKEQAANKAAKQEATKRLRGIVPEGRLFTRRQRAPQGLPFLPARSPMSLPRATDG